MSVSSPLPRVKGAPRGRPPQRPASRPVAPRRTSPRSSLRPPAGSSSSAPRPESRSGETIRARNRPSGSTPRCAGRRAAPLGRVTDARVFRELSYADNVAATKLRLAWPDGMKGAPAVTVFGTCLAERCEQPRRSLRCNPSPPPTRPAREGGTRAVSSVGRAPRLHRGGRRFEPVTAHFDGLQCGKPAFLHGSGMSCRRGLRVPCPLGAPRRERSVRVASRDATQRGGMTGSYRLG